MMEWINSRRCAACLVYPYLSQQPSKLISAQLWLFTSQKPRLDRPISRIGITSAHARVKGHGTLAMQNN